MVDAGSVKRVSLVVHTNPKDTTIGKKKPEIMEIIVSGKSKEHSTKQWNY